MSGLEVIMSNIIQTVQMNLNKAICLTIMTNFVANFNYWLCLKCMFLFWNGMNILFKMNWTTFRKKIDNIIKKNFLLAVIY